LIVSFYQSISGSKIGVFFSNVLFVYLKLNLTLFLGVISDTRHASPTIPVKGSIYMFL